MFFIEWFIEKTLSIPRNLLIFEFEGKIDAIKGANWRGWKWKW